MKTYSIHDLVQFLNKAWKEAGQTSEIVIKNEHITITGEEVIVKAPVEMEIRIPRERFDAETVSPCSNSLNKPK